MSEQDRGPDPDRKQEEPEEQEITVSRKAQSRPDRAGDPLDGLVNLFDLGIVLAVAFLLAALSSLQLSDLLTKKDVSVVRQNGNKQTVITKENNKVKSVNLTKQKVVGQGTRVGTVYRLDDGRTVVVQDGGAPDASTTTPAPDTTTPDSSGLPPASGTTTPDDGLTPPAVPTTPDSGITSPFG